MQDMMASEAEEFKQWGNNFFGIGALRTAPSSSSDQRFLGMIEEVRIWRVLRTDEQLMDNLFSSLRSETRGLQAYYSFDVESVLEDECRVVDHSFEGIDLHYSNDTASKPGYMLSTAPIGHEIALMRCALSQIETKFQETSDDRVTSCEYADMQCDARGNLGGVLKRCYTYIKDGKWVLITGYKIGNLTLEWIGQAQFDPQVIGFVEGAPLVPSENMTAGVLDSADNISVLNVTESENVTYSVGVTKEGSVDLVFAAGASYSAGSDDLLILAPLGIGTAKKLTEISFDAQLKGDFNVAEGWSQENFRGYRKNRSRSLTVATVGGLESDDPDIILNPAVGRRTLMGNNGFAVVQSSTADVFALRIQNNALVSLQMVPNPDIPPDWNLISFPINPRYTKQGTLDGRVGYLENGRVCFDPDYKGCARYGEYSYYKPTEAYKLQQKIRRTQQQNQSYYEDFGTSYGSAIKPVAGTAAAAAASLMIPGVGTVAAAAAMAGGLAIIGKTFKESKTEEKFAKRDIVNT